MISIRELRYIAEEVTRQGAGPMHVLWMAGAWERAKADRSLNLPVTPVLIEAWGRLVDPEANAGGFRRVNVQVGGRLCPHWTEALVRLDHLCEGLREISISPDFAYRELLAIHPLRDGNGRTGKIFLNYLADTLEAPTMPSDWFGCANP